MPTITAESLEQMGACREAVEMFRRDFPDGYDLARWTREEQLRMVRTEWRRYLGWAWMKMVVPIWTMRDADLSGADLSAADLSGCDLSRSDLSDADLGDADLSGCDLSRSDLSGADLSDADLRDADLSGARWCTCTRWPAGFDARAATGTDPSH